MRFLFRLCVVVLPWFVRRRVLRWIYGYEIHPTARIGCSWIFPRHLVLRERATIGHGNVAIHLDRVELGADAHIDRGNWITGYPRRDRRHFSHVTNREPVLLLGRHASVTKRHHFDCTDRIRIGAFATIAGYGSQFLTHAIDLEHNRQDAAPIEIGEYCMVGTAVAVLPGAGLPARSVLGAKALLNKAHGAPGWLYAGVPAAPLRQLSPEAAYFRRTTGFVT